MSSGSRWAIGFVACLTGAVLIFMGCVLGDEMPHGGWPAVVGGAFVMVVAIACFFPLTWPVTLRVIGGGIFLVYVIYVISSLGGPDFWWALMGFGVIGVPFGFLAIFGSYPRWGRGAAALQREPEDDPEAEPDED